MKTQFFCAQCGKQLNSGQSGASDDLFFTDSGSILCAACEREYVNTRARKREEEQRRAQMLPSLPGRGQFDSDIAYCISCAKALGASDIHLKEGCCPYFRIAGDIVTASGAPLTRETLLSFLTEYAGVDGEQFLLSDTAMDFSFELSGIRLRGNAFRDQNGVSISLRLLTLVSEDFTELGIPEILKQLSERRSGLILITGPTGSGKTTTLTCLIEYINRTRHAHIIMLEDPIEFLHTNRGCIISQREIGRDARSFGDAITEAMREDPDIIMVGEMRDHASIEAALRAAETGHLVLSTLHTKGAINSITRIVDVFPTNQQNQIRTQLGMSLLGVVSQQLLPGTAQGKRHLATEVMIVTDPIRAMIRQDKLHLVASAIQTSLGDGMYTMKHSMEKLLREGKITEQTFASYQI